jgi:hypothetical protein
MASFVDRLTDFVTATASAVIEVLTIGIDLWNGAIELCEGVVDVVATLTVDAIDIGTDWICGLFLFPVLKSAEAPADVLESAPALVEEADAASYVAYDDAESDAISFDTVDTADAGYTDLYLDLPDSDVLVVDSVASEDIAVVGVSLEVEDAEAFA